MKINDASHFFPVACCCQLLLSLTPVLAAGPAPLGGRWSGRPLCNQLATLMHVKRGSADYLRPYASVMRGIGPNWSGGAEQCFPTFRRRQAAIGKLVAALAHPTHVAALRDRLLMGSDYHGIVLHARGWKFGSSRARMLLAAFIGARAGRLFDAGHRARARQFANAALLLDAQESCLHGQWLALFFWQKFKGLSPRDMKSIKVLPKAQADFWRWRWSAAMALQIPPHAQHVISTIYRRASKRRARLGRRLQALSNLMKHPPVSHTQARRALERTLMPVIGSVRDMGEWALALNNVAFMWHQALRGGHSWVAGAVASQLSGIATRIRRRHGYSRPERAAVLRWIKEAMGP